MAFLSLWHNPLAMFGLVILALLAAAAVLATWIALYDPTKMDDDSRVAAPGGAHWFGTDDPGSGHTEPG